MNLVQRREHWAARLWDWGALTLAMVIVAGAVFFFLMPTHAAVSSVAGAAIILANFIPLPVSIITLIINLFLLLAGFLTFGRAFGIKTVYTGILLSVLLRIFEILLPDYSSITGSDELDVICYVLTVSVGLTILFRHNASSGGMDVAAQILHKYLHIDVGRAMSLAGICIALSSALVYDGKTVILGLLGTYFNGIVLDQFIFGQNVKRKVCIITRQVEALRDFILYELHSGATIYHAVGAYSGESFREMIVVVDRTEYQKLMSFVERVDPDAFLTVYTISDIRFRPKTGQSASVCLGR